MLTFAVSTQAQQVPAQNDEEIVRLSPFSVQESADMGRYQAVEATSGSRIRMDLMDSSQSISVVTNEFMVDVGTGRVNDAAKYVAGINANNNLNAFDGMFMRGFWLAGGTIDGFYQFNWINQEPVIIERMEVVKGPNAILAPQGLPGGVVNLVTKKPLFTNKGYVSYQIGRYDSNRAEIDVNYVVRADKLAVRIVGSLTDADDYAKGDFHQNITVMPMFTYRISSTTDFTLQFQAYNASLLANNGIPISLYALGRNNVHRLEGLPRDFQVVGRNITRHQSGQNTRFFLTSQITDKLSMRLVGNWIEQSTRPNLLWPSNPLDVNGNPGEVVILNQITGEWEWDGVTRNDSPRYTLGGANEWPKITHGNLQNDFVYEHTGSNWKSQTVMGYAFNYNSQHQRIKDYVSDPTLYDFTDPNYTPPSYTLMPNWRNNWSSRNRSNQVYLYEVLNLFDDRLVISGSLSQNRYVGNVQDNLTSIRSEDKAEALLPSGGFVYKLTPGASVFYGFSKQEVLGAEDPTVDIPPHTIPGRQHEGGVRIRVFEGRLYATLAYFDILQEGLWTQDPRNFITPRPNPPWPPSSEDRTSKGFEFELNWSPTKNLSIIGSYTNLKSRDSDGMRDDGPQKYASVWASYTFDTGLLRGLRIGIGGVYTGEAPILAGRHTTPPAGYDPVRIQPKYWKPSYVLADASASYSFKKNWQLQLVIKNLFDKDGLDAFMINPPINPKLTLRYEF